MLNERSSPKTFSMITIRAAGDWAPDRVTPSGDLILSDHDEGILQALGRRFQIGDGTNIYEEGTPDDRVWLILSGIVRMSHLGEEGTRTVLAFYWPGDIFGLSEGGAYVSTADTLSEVTLLSFDRDKLRKALLRALLQS